MVVAFGWNPAGRRALGAAACGVHEFLPKQLAADPLMGRIEDLHRNRNRDRGPESSPPQGGDCQSGVEDAGLTSRELEVLTLIATGQSNAEIAADLFVSLNTVKTYIRTAYRKIGVQRRAQCVRWAMHHGLGTPPNEVDFMALVTTERPRR
jgi:DNA-binding NarL/FixJ family response regulator